MKDMVKMQCRIKDLTQRVAEYEATFWLQHRRMGQATKLWRKAHPGNDLVLPDLGELLDWLMARYDVSEALLMRTQRLSRRRNP